MRRLKVKVDAGRDNGRPVYGLLGVSIASWGARWGARRVVRPVDAGSGVGLGDEVVRGVPCLSLAVPFSMSLNMRAGGKLYAY